MAEAENRKMSHGRFSLYREHKLRFSTGKSDFREGPKWRTWRTCVGAGVISGARRPGRLVRPVECAGALGREKRKLKARWG